MDETEVVGRIHIGFHYNTHMADFQLSAAEEYQITGYQILFGYFLTHKKHVARTAGKFDAVLTKTVIDEARAVEMVGTSGPVFVYSGGFLGEGQLYNGVNGGTGDGCFVVSRNSIPTTITTSAEMPRQ